MIRDLYDLVEPPERGAELRRLNKERLAKLEADGRARNARIAIAREYGEHGSSR